MEESVFVKHSHAEAFDMPRPRDGHEGVAFEEQTPTGTGR
jgi:hypothetical protein